MAVKKQPESDAGGLHEAPNDWFRQFLKHLEIYMFEAGQELPSDAKSMDCCFAAMRAAKWTLLDSGLDNEQILNLFGSIALEERNVVEKLEWNAELNRRRFELIDGDIQGTLSRVEQLELAGLTQLMREHLDSEVNLPLEGARKLHHLLVDFDSESTDSDQ